MITSSASSSSLSLSSAGAGAAASSSSTSSPLSLHHHHHHHRHNHNQHHNHHHVIFILIIFLILILKSSHGEGNFRMGGPCPNIPVAMARPVLVTSQVPVLGTIHTFYPSHTHFVFCGCPASVRLLDMGLPAQRERQAAILGLGHLPSIHSQG